MEFQPIVSTLFAWIFGMGICALLIIQAVRIQQSNFTPQRKGVKQFLNGLFFLALLAFMLNPVWSSEPSSKPVLLVSEDIEKNQLDFWKDSLGIEESIRAEDYQSNSDSLILLGTAFPKELLYSLRAKSVNWIIPNLENEPSFLKWKGVLRQGELQKIRLGLELKSGSKLSIAQAGNELKKYEIDADRSEFEIGISASILGRNEWEILVDEESMGTIRFFVLPNPLLTFQIQVGFPGPEIRTLSRFLIGKGQEVQEEIQLSKNTELRTEKQPLDSVEVFIIDPSQIQDSKILKQLDRGISVFLLNLGDPEKDVNALNKAFGTDFEIVSSNTTENRSLENRLEALPFEFKTKTTQKSLLENSVAVQQVGNSKIGLSLLTGTFSLAQAGDSLTYAKVWEEILAELRPETTSNWKLDAPIFQHQFYSIEFNGTDSLEFSQFKSENLSLEQSMINPNSKTLKGSIPDSSWQKIGVDVEAYIYRSENWQVLFAHQDRARFLQSKAWLSSNLEQNAIKKAIPIWFWGLVFCALFTLIWLEPKVDN